jgi:phospholipid-binding lipoprotein MlaA
MFKKFAILNLVCAVFLAVFSSDSYAKVVDFDDSEFEAFDNQNEEEVYDPLEKYNRKIFVFNDFLDRYFLEYVARGYRDNIPKPARDSVHNFLNNLNSPISAFNSLLQGKGNNGLATFSNFLINSTIGVFGLFDVAGEKGIRYHPEDFGQTLGHYGVKSGPYLMVPFVGPSSIRDLSGTVTDQVVSPASYNYFKIGGKNYLIGDEALIAVTLMHTVDTRESLIDIIDDVRRESFDPYATLRSAYTQKRNNEIKN